MGFSLKIGLFALAVSATSSVAPARDAPTLAALPAAWSLGGADETPVFDLPRVETVSVADLLDDSDTFSGLATVPVASVPAQPDVPAGDPARDARGDLASLSLLQLVEIFADTEVRDVQMDCLARAIYFESRGEPLHGQLAVGEVVVNRAASRRFPDDYCSVVRAYRQFSFVRAGVIPEPRRDSEAWATAVGIARIAEARHHATALDGALFFHANYVDPRWRLTRIGAIGNHVFYR